MGPYRWAKCFNYLKLAVANFQFYIFSYIVNGATYSWHAPSLVTHKLLCSLAHPNYMLSNLHTVVVLSHMCVLVHVITMTLKTAFVLWNRTPMSQQSHGSNFYALCYLLESSLLKKCYDFSFLSQWVEIVHHWYYRRIQWFQLFLMVFHWEALLGLGILQ